MRALLSVLILALCGAIHAEVSAIYGKFSPDGFINVHKPIIAWQITPTGGGKVSHVDMLVNQVPVVAAFNETTSSVEYRPIAPMAPGLYTVNCRVTIDREVTVRQEWAFEVGEPFAGPGGSAAVTAALDETNLIRQELGLEPFRLDNRIAAAAAAHTRYQVLNGLTCHVEDPSKPGFCGKLPWDRIQRFGYKGVCFEGACGNQVDPRRAVRQLFDAPYHRIAFLQPGSPDIGIGFERGEMTIDYAVSDEEGVGISPSAGQTGVPVSWDGNESPSPLRLHQARGRVGYPIVFGLFTRNVEDAAVQSMKLFGPDGTLVPTFLNTPSNDRELRFAGVLIPKEPLKPNTTYRVEVVATSRRATFERKWTFSTGSQ